MFHLSQSAVWIEVFALSSNIKHSTIIRLAKCTCMRILATARTAVPRTFRSDDSISMYNARSPSSVMMTCRVAGQRAMFEIACMLAVCKSSFCSTASNTRPFKTCVTVETSEVTLDTWHLNSWTKQNLADKPNPGNVHNIILTNKIKTTNNIPLHTHKTSCLTRRQRSASSTRTHTPSPQPPTAHRPPPTPHPRPCICPSCK